MRHSLGGTHSPGDNALPQVYIYIFGNKIAHIFAISPFHAQILHIGEICLDIMPPSQQNIFHQGIPKNPLILRQVGLATGKKLCFEVIQRSEEYKPARRRTVTLLTAVQHSAWELPALASDDA